MEGVGGKSWARMGRATCNSSGVHRQNGKQSTHTLLDAAQQKGWRHAGIHRERDLRCLTQMCALEYFYNTKAPELSISSFLPSTIKTWTNQPISIHANTPKNNLENEGRCRYDLHIIQYVRTYVSPLPFTSEPAAKATNCTRRSTPGSRFDTRRMRLTHMKYSSQAAFWAGGHRGSLRYYGAGWQDEASMDRPCC